MDKNSINKSIILIGMMGAGKTTTGEILSKKLKIRFIDLDKLIEEKSKMTITEIFRLYGEEHFRKLESETVENLPKDKKIIVSTGGGVVENKKNVDKLRKIGKLYYLWAPAEALFERIKHEVHRPLLQTTNPLLTIEKILKRRSKLYETADFKISTLNKNAKQITDEIAGIYERINGQA